MGCWNETCALSGLPILEGEECARLEFTDVDLIAFCCIESFDSFFRALKDVKFGAYDGYGRLKGDKSHDEVEDGVVFILKHFWDDAVNGDKLTSDVVEREYKSTQKLTESFVAFEEESRKHNPDKEPEDPFEYLPGGARHFHKDPQMFRELLYVFLKMPGLRRMLYTAGYRGAQSTDYAWKTQLEMSRAVQAYIEEKARNGAIDIN